MSTVIYPGSVIGVLGSGQLGRMFAIAARRMGYRVHVLSPDDDTPTGQVADVEIRAEYEDLDAVAEFARRVDVVTFEFENVPSATVERAARSVPIRPGGQVLHTVQNRIREKNFLHHAGFPVTPFAPVHSRDELEAAIQLVGLPAVMKTAAWGYDGKGQRRVSSLEEARQAWDQLGSEAVVLEQWVNFQAELSVVAARGLRGDVHAYSPIANTHRNHILDLSIAPANLSARTTDEAIEIARSVMSRLDVVGVMCMEYLLTEQGELLVNEIAPRPHNSGHLTIDAHQTCQFEQQVRAVCGLPLGSVEQLRPAAMVNLLGDLWAEGEPVWEEACGIPNVKLHLYGKQQWRRGRKMGHLTALAADTATAAATAIEARRRLAHNAEHAPLPVTPPSPLLPAQ